MKLRHSARSQHTLPETSFPCRAPCLPASVGLLRKRYWCRGGKSNPHALRRRCLRPLRLPIPSPRLGMSQHWNTCRTRRALSDKLDRPTMYMTPARHRHVPLQRSAATTCARVGEPCTGRTAVNPSVVLPIPLMTKVSIFEMLGRIRNAPIIVLWCRAAILTTLRNPASLLAPWRPWAWFTAILAPARYTP